MPSKEDLADFSTLCWHRGSGRLQLWGSVLLLPFKLAQGHGADPLKDHGSASTLDLPQSGPDGRSAALRAGGSHRCDYSVPFCLGTTTGAG